MALTERQISNSMRAWRQGVEEAYVVLHYPPLAHHYDDTHRLLAKAVENMERLRAELAERLGTEYAQT